MSIEVEGLRVKGVLIKDFLKDDFVADIEALNKDVEVVALVVMKKNGEKGIPTPIVFNHQNTNEVKDKILHLDCSDAEILQKLSKIVEKRIKR